MQLTIDIKDSALTSFSYEIVVNKRLKISRISSLTNESFILASDSKPDYISNEKYIVFLQDFCVLFLRI